MVDLKPVYRAVTKEAAELALDELEPKWTDAYPLFINSWCRKWHNLSHDFKCPEHIRSVIYITNVLEGVHRQFRRLTKIKGAFPNENSLQQLLYANILNTPAKWMMPIHNWSLCLSQLAIYFEGRLDSVLDI